MKLIHRSFYFSISLILLSLTFSGFAEASFNRHGHSRHGFTHSFGRHNKHFRSNKFAFKHRSINHFRYSRHGYGSRFIHHGNFNHFTRKPFYSRKNRLISNKGQFIKARSKQSSKPCHLASKIYYDKFGYPYKATGTMCYTQDGEGYIVEGSRYINR